MPTLKVPAATVVLVRLKDRSIRAFYELQTARGMERVKFPLGRRSITNVDTAKTIVRDALNHQVDQLTIKECE